MFHRSGASGRAGAHAEHPIPDDLDHLHTATPALAGIASKAATSSATSWGNATSRARRGLLRSWTTVVVAATLALGGALLASSPAGAASAVPNGVTAHGAKMLGSPPATLAQPAVGITATPSHNGYWVVAADGGVFTFGDAHYFGSTGAIRLTRPIVGIAGTPTGDGYWLVADDGGVFSFGDARFFGSLGAQRLAAPIVGVAATPTGDGYWLVGRDGGVFSFGDARFFGSTGGVRLTSPVVGMTSSHRGDGYLLVARDGGVFAFGDARFSGSAANPSQAPAVAIATAASGDGYAIARADGHVSTFDTAYHGDAVGIGDAPVVGIAEGRSGYWLAHGVKPTVDLSGHPFLACTRHHESDTSGGYHAVSASGTYRGAYQFSRSTWDNTARRAGRFDLVGVDPATAAPADQDFLALMLYQWQGASPWGGRCSGM